MEIVQRPESKKNNHRDKMNNEVSSTSSDEHPVTKFNNFYTNRYETASDNEVDRSVRTYKNNTSDNEEIPRRSHKNNDSDNQRTCKYTETSDIEIVKPRVRTHYKSMGNINEYKTNLTVQNSISNIDLSLHSGEVKKFDTLQIPIVGYEVMEERAKFTIYKLKVEDDKRDQSWLVFRRYTDFVRLYTRLKAEQPNIILPLPGKRWFRDNYEPAFLEERVRGLQIFVNAIISKLPNHPIVRDFFCLDEPPQVFTYQPEVQAVYGALEDSITSLKMKIKQKDATIMHLQKRLSQLETQANNCPNCSK